ncbi:PREDICTED: keratin-associated protein 5-1-like [Acropora digitifera]|uniref:keratin-associated protein 5-1-like n=1 Tax=Acropora digitifera TaxID=70779 RepID=UPI00077A06CA|nr:PREDICTED: keratin-associated protein 5-1-like [Acropora digitifera]
MSSVLSNAVVLLLIVSFRFSVIFSWCSRSSSSCGSYQVCCNSQCVYGSNCLGESCSWDSHCSVDESCCSGKCRYGSTCLGKYCSKTSDCSVNEACCGSKCQYGSNCLGEYCSKQSDCLGYEACCSGKCRSGYSCIGQSCSNKSDCSVNEACCSGKCRSGYDCSDQSCSKKSDCSTYEACCSGKCRSGSDCSGKFCGSNNDCSVGQKCCSNTCSNYACDDPSAAIAIAVVSTIVGLSLIFMLIYCCNRPARLGRSDGVEMGGQVATSVATTTQSAIHAPPQESPLLTTTEINASLPKKFVHEVPIIIHIVKVRTGS